MEGFNSLVTSDVKMNQLIPTGEDIMYCVTLGNVVKKIQKGVERVRKNVC